MLVASLDACGLVQPNSDGAGGGAPSGGADAASGGTEVTSGGTESVGSGGSVIGPSGGTPAEGGSGFISQDEWREATAPVSGPHEIWTYDSCDPPHAGSNSVRVGQEYSVIPSIGTTAGPDFEANAIYYAVLMDYCLTPADCTEHPHGACEGFISDAYCEYAEPPEPDLCWVDEECTRKPEGTCVLPVGPYAFEVCYPTGECVEPSGKCTYAGDTPCEDDADCDEGADGRCIFPVDTRCAYDLCHEDDECADGERCGCGRCETADCARDDACPEGETCAFGRAFCFGRTFQCTTPDDLCAPEEEEGCTYQGSHWGYGICTK
jgi:hypothetical protein